MNNAPQDPDYEGLPYHEKKFHKTHFGAVQLRKRTHPKDDPDWEYIGVGRWKRKETRNPRAERLEAQDEE